MAVLYAQLEEKVTEVNLIKEFKAGVEGQNAYFLFLVLFLMPINWLLEATKWRLFVRHFQQKFTFKQSLESVLCGLLFGFITPNRIGEFGGRLLGLQKEHWAKGLTAGFWGGIAQFIVTVGIGGVFFIKHVDRVFQVLKGFQITLYVLYAIGVSVAIIVFFQLPRVIQSLGNVPFIKKILQRFSIHFNVPSQNLLLVLFITAFRFSIYTTQYTFLLFFFGVNEPYFFLYGIIATMLFIHTIVPSYTIIDLGVRGNVLLLLLGAVSSNAIGIISTVLVVWTLNLLIPALVGYMVFVRKKWNYSREEVSSINPFAHIRSLLSGSGSKETV